MSNQGIKQYGTYYSASIRNGASAYVNLSKQFENIHLNLPLYNSKYLLSPINLDLIYTSSNSSVDFYFQTGFRLSIVKELSYNSSLNRYTVTNSDMSIETYVYQNGRHMNDELVSYIVFENNQYKVVYKESVYTFDSSFKLILIEDRNNSINKIRFNYSQGYLISIENDYDEKITFSKTSSQVSMQITKSNIVVCNIYMNVSNSRINSISYCVYKSSDEEYDNIQLTYSNYLEIYNTYSKERIRIKHPSSNIYKVLEGNTSSDSTLKETTITFVDNYETYTSFSGMYTYYYFDNRGLVNHVVDFTKSIVGYKFDDAKKIIYKSSLFKNNYQHQAEIGNLIDDGFCQQSIASWFTDYASLSRGTNYASHISVTSSYCLYISNSSINHSNTYQLLEVSGTPQDLYTFRCLTQFSSANSGSKINIYLIKGIQNVQTISYDLEGIPSCYFFNLLEIKPVKDFDHIKVEFHINGLGAFVGVESICLTKQVPGVFYEYDASREVILKNTGVSKVHFFRDIRHKVRSTSSKYNVSSCNYNYVSTRDNDLVTDNLLKTQKGLFGTYSNYNYNDTNQVVDDMKCTPKYDASILHDKVHSIRKKNYYQVGHEYISRVKTEDKEIRYVNDGTKHYLLRFVQFPNGTRYHYNYNARNNLISVGINESDIAPAVSDNSIAYDSTNLEVANLIDKGLNETKFTYNSDNRLSSVRIKDSNDNYKNLVDIKYVNESSANAPHLPLISSKQYGISGDKYTIEYDNKYNLSLIKLRKHGTSVDENKYSFTYDAYNRLSAVTDEANNAIQNIYYDNENRVNKIINGSNTYNLKYDDEGSINYLYNLERNTKLYQSFNSSNKCKERSPEKFYHFIKTLNLGNPNYNCYSCFFDESTESNQVITRSNDLTCKSETGEVISGANDTSNNCIAKTKNLIPELELGASDANRLNYDLSLLSTKAVFTFFNGAASGTLLSISTNNNDIIELCKYNTELEIDKNGNHLGATIPITFSFDKSYVLVLVLDGTSLHIFINDLHYIRALGATSFTNLKYGKTYLLNQGYIKLNGIVTTALNDISTIKLISKEGYNALFGSVYDKGNFCAASVEETILIDHDLAEEFIVFPLNNSFEAINGNNRIKLLEYTKRSNSLDSDDFIFNDKNDKYSLLLDYNKVVYRTHLTDEGTVLINFTISEYSLFASDKVLFRLYNSSSEIALLITANKELVLKLNSNTYNLGLYINPYIFNRIGFSYKGSSSSFMYRVYLNDETVDSSKPIALNLDDLLNIQLGNNYDLSMPLNGYMETLCLNDCFNTLSYISEYIDKYNISNYVSAYDELGRIRGSKIRFDDNTYNNYSYVTRYYNKYEYETDEDDETNLTSRIKSESFNLSDSSSFSHNYSYDDTGRIINIISGNTPLKEYEYNVYGYITKDKYYQFGTNYKQNQYSYDDSGNIIQKIKSGSNITTEILTYEYGYVNNDNHTINKNALVRIKNGNTITESITYDNYMNSLPVSITKNNVTTNLTWEGMKLKSYGNISYDYDYLGRRVSKVITNGKSYKYNYDIRGNMVSEEITSNNVTTIVKYLYDVNNNVYGLIYNGNIYYYVKNILGEILYIIDKYGDVRVEYNYDAYGNILSINGNMATTLGNNNHIVYKSYYIDFENDLYYLKSRYYNPNWGRFISSDRIEYLDPSVASGLNLYCYCLNNPVMYDDPEGSAVPIVLIAILAIIAINHAITGVEIIIAGNQVKDQYSKSEAEAAIGEIIGKKAKVEDDNIKIYDSFDVYSRYKRILIAKIIQNTVDDNGNKITNRSIYSLVSEWAVHNIAYDFLSRYTDDEKSIKRAQHVDLNANFFENGVGTVVFTIITGVIGCL